MKVSLLKTVAGTVFMRLTGESEEEAQQLRLFANTYIDKPTAPRYGPGYLNLEVKDVDIENALPTPGEDANFVLTCRNCQSVLQVAFKDGKPDNEVIRASGLTHKGPGDYGDKRHFVVDCPECHSVLGVDAEGGKVSAKVEAPPRPKETE